MILASRGCACCFWYFCDSAGMLWLIREKKSQCGFLFLRSHQTEIRWALHISPNLKRISIEIQKNSYYLLDSLYSRYIYIGKGKTRSLYQTRISLFAWKTHIRDPGGMYIGLSNIARWGNCNSPPSSDQKNCSPLCKACRLDGSGKFKLSQDGRADLGFPAGNIPNRLDPPSGPHVCMTTIETDKKLKSRILEREVHLISKQQCTSNGSSLSNKVVTCSII